MVEEDTLAYWQVDLMKEHKRITLGLHSLDNFITAITEFREMSESDRKQIWRQRDAMVEYRNALFNRIYRFNPEYRYPDYRRL